MDMAAERQDKRWAFGFGATFCAALMYAALRQGATINAYQFWLLRVVAAVAAAGVAAMVPSFISVSMKIGTRVALRAGGALAVFLVVYRVNPPDLVVSPLSASTGAGSNVSRLPFEIADARLVPTDAGVPLLDIVVSNNSADEALVTSIAIRPVSDVKLTSQPPKGPLLETTAVYSLLTDASGFGKAEGLRLALPSHKLERLLILPRVGVRTGSRVSAPLMKNGDVVETLSGRFALTIQISTGVSLSREFDMTLFSTFGEAQPVEIGLPRQIASLNSKDPSAVDTAVDILSAVGDERACAALRALEHSDLTFMKDALSQPPLDEEMNLTSVDGGTFDEFLEFKRKLRMGTARSCGESR
jgi:hypothetical protein